MREAEICLNKCQIPRLHIVCQRSFEPPQKNAPDASGDTPATNRLERRLTTFKWPQRHRDTETQRHRDTEEKRPSRKPLFSFCSVSAVSLWRYLPSSTMKRVSTPLARISGAYIAWPRIGRAWNLPG